jgi:hypothetical protein
MPGGAAFATTIHPDVAGRRQVPATLEPLIPHTSAHPGALFFQFHDRAEDLGKSVPPLLV